MCLYPRHPTPPFDRLIFPVLMCPYISIPTIHVTVRAVPRPDVQFRAYGRVCSCLLLMISDDWSAIYTDFTVYRMMMALVEIVLWLMMTLDNAESALPPTLIFIEGAADSPGGLYCESPGATRSELDCAIAAARHPLYRYGFYSDDNGCHLCRAQDPWMETSTMEVQRPRPLHIQG